MANKKDLYIMSEIKKIAEKTGKPVIEVIDAYIKKNGSNKYLEGMKELQLQKEREKIWQKIQTDIENAIADREQGTEIEIIEKLMIDIRDGNTDYGLDDKGRNEILKKMQSRIKNIKSEEQKEVERKVAEEEAKKAAERKAAEEARKEAERKAAEEQAKKEKPEISEETKGYVEELEKMAEEYIVEGKITSKCEYLRSIRNLALGKYKQAVIKLNDNIDKDELARALDARIDEIYFQQVNDFTNGFEILRENVMINNGASGNKSRKLFTDSDCYYRFYDLRKTIIEKIIEENLNKKIRIGSEVKHRNQDEKEAIEKILKENNISDIDKDILVARKAVIDKEIEFKSAMERRCDEVR